MTTLSIQKVTTLPGTLAGNTLYLVAPTARPDFVELYVTSVAGSGKRVLNQADVEAIVAAGIAGASTTQVVANIAARNALVVSNGMLALVLDATADATVASGAATYVYVAATTSWAKISEAESMDLAFAWTSITGRPSSTPAQIDSAVGNAHTHANLTQLGLISQDAGGNLTYSGSTPKAGLSSIDW